MASEIDGPSHTQAHGGHDLTYWVRHLGVKEISCSQCAWLATSPVSSHSSELRVCCRAQAAAVELRLQKLLGGILGYW